MEKQFVLFKGEVWELVRPDHFGNPDYCLLRYADKIGVGLKYVNFKSCTPLDPALNVLFERDENG